MIFPLLLSFLLTVLLGNRFYLGAIEGFADSVASFLKLWSGGRSDQAARRKGFVIFGYSLAAVARPLIGVSSLRGSFSSFGSETVSVRASVPRYRTP